VTPLIEVSELVVQAGSATILDRVRLSVTPGEIIALVGPNGAGKSTLLRVLSGELRPSSGHVSLQGQPIDAYSPRALSEHRAMLSQHTTVTFPFTVSEIVRMGAGQSRSRAWTDEVLGGVLAQCDVAHLTNQTVTSLSGGEQQRVHLARTLLQLLSSRSSGPKLLLLDEPTASLDIAHQLMVIDVIKAQAAAGTTIVVVLHDLNLAVMLATRIVMMNGGRILLSDEPQRVITNETIRSAFGVSESVGIVPRDETPFVLPHSMKVSPQEVRPTLFCMPQRPAGSATLLVDQAPELR
jgi:iron complex transport system ATP-binding protein